MKQSNDIDEDIKELIKNLNRFKFLKTVHSCSGHDKGCPYISFKIKDLDKGFKFLYDLINHLNRFGKRRFGKHEEAQFVSGKKNEVILYINPKNKHGKSRRYDEILELWKEAEKFVKKQVNR